MTDIVERLRAWRNEDHEDNHVCSRYEIITLLTEIERLQTEVNYLRTSKDEARAEIERLRNENEQMRQALEIVAEASTDQLKVLQAKNALSNIGPSSECE